MKGKNISKKYMLVLVFATILLSVTAVPYVYAKDIDLPMEKNERLKAQLQAKLSKFGQKLDAETIDKINIRVDAFDNLTGGVLTIHPMLRDIIIMLFEIVALFVGHNAVTALLVIGLTIWWVVPIIMVQDIFGGVGIDWSIFSTMFNQLMDAWSIGNFLYMWGILGLILYPLAICWAGILALIATLSSGGASQGTYWERVLDDIADTYNGTP